jgi:hypothetical protein
MTRAQPSGVAPSPGSRTRKPTLEDRLIARMLGRSIDRELAAGVAAPISQAHTARVDQLTTERTRRSVARTLEKLIVVAERPPPRVRITATPCREQVRQAEELIRSTAARLRSAEPLDARGIAGLRTLLSNFSGPCYVPGLPDALKVALQEVSNSLDLADCTGRGTDSSRPRNRVQGKPR